MINIDQHTRDHEINQEVSTSGKILVLVVDDKENRFDFSSLADDNYIIEDCLLPYNPFQSIVISGDEVKISLFIDDAYKTEGFVCPFSGKTTSIVPVPTADNNLEMAKTSQIALIESGFAQEFDAGHFMSATIGIEVDCRRGGNRNDEQNIQGLIDDYVNLSPMEKHYVGFTETTTFELTLEQLTNLKLELIRYAKSNYVKKWTLEAEIQAATTIEQVKVVTW